MSAQSDSKALDDVKKSSWVQREALPGEPQCVICGRYGEYICDQTDDDVCSLECKRYVLRSISKLSIPGDCKPFRGLTAPDECFYVRESDNPSEAKSLNNGQIEVLRKKLEIVVEGDSIPEPILSFCSCELAPKLLSNLEAAGYAMPTALQMQAIPSVLCGKNLFVSAETGSGKTISFLVPIISRLAKVRACNEEALAIVLAPTRELCIDIEQKAKLLGKGMPFKTALVVGGDAMAAQLYRIQQGVGMIVATPGRLIDLLLKHNIELDSVSILVLDEVDCMLQRGFRDQVMQIVTALSQPQVVMYSATTSHEVERVAKSIAKGLAFITSGKPNRASRSVKQVAIWVDPMKKKQKLFDILQSKQHFVPPAVVFVGLRAGADLLSEAIFSATGIKALSIHGEKPMKERKEVVKSFLLGEVPVVVATGVLGRGVDLFRVKQVIIFDMPNSAKEYIHQIGRAARLGEEGRSIVFVNDEDKRLFPELIKLLKSGGAAIPRELANSQHTPGLAKAEKKRKFGC